MEYRVCLCSPGGVPSPGCPQREKKVAPPGLPAKWGTRGATLGPRWFRGREPTLTSRTDTFMQGAQATWSVGRPGTGQLKADRIGRPEVGLADREPAGDTTPQSPLSGEPREPQVYAGVPREHPWGNPVLPRGSPRVPWGYFGGIPRGYLGGTTVQPGGAPGVTREIAGVARG